MKCVSKQISLLAMSVVTVLSLAAVPASAEHGSGNTSDTGSGSSGNGSTTNVTQMAESEYRSGVLGASSGTQTGDDSGGSLRDQARKLLQAKRQNAKEHTEEQRQKACQQRQKSIGNRTSNYAAAAQRHLDVFNSIFTKVKAFHDSKQLNVSSYDALVTASTAKQTTAQTAVDALKALNTQIDCTQSDPASTVATIKSAVSDARTTLQDYRKTLKDLVVALKGASTAQPSPDTTTGGDQQ